MNDKEAPIKGVTRREFLTGGLKVAALATMAPVLEACGLSVESKPVKGTMISRSEMSPQMLLAWDEDTDAKVTRQLKVTVENSGIPKGKDVGFRLIETKKDDGTTSVDHVAFVVKPGELSRAMSMKVRVREDVVTGEKFYVWEAESRENPGIYSTFMEIDLGYSEISTEPLVAKKQVDKIIEDRAEAGKLTLKITNVMQKNEAEIPNQRSFSLQEAYNFVSSGRVLAEGVPTVILEPTDIPTAFLTPTFIMVPTPEPTETLVPPTATNVPTKEATATTVPTKEATKKPTVTASPTKPEATPVAKEGEVYIGKDFVALSDEKIVELLSKPENKGKIIIPVYVDEGTTVRIDPYRTNGTVFYVYDSASRDVFNPSLSMKSKYIVKAPNMDGFVIDFSDTPVEVLAVIGQDTKDNLSEEFSFGTTLLTGAVDAPTLGITGPYIVAICEINVINGDHTTTVRAEDSLLKITDSQGNSRYVTRQVPK